MTITDLASTAQALVAGGKGILAADETPGTLTRRLDALKPDVRRSIVCAPSIIGPSATAQPPWANTPSPWKASQRQLEAR